MNVSDRDRLRHMLDAALRSGKAALAFVEGRTQDDLRASRLLVSALARQIEIVGEAAARTSADCKIAIPGIPWPVVLGMRNRLIHAYFDVDLEIVWTTVTVDFPDMVRVLEGVLVERGEK
jgi:uncharacterized protein with HEPN domain